MKCSARKPSKAAVSVLGFFSGLMDRVSCDAEASFFGPDGKPLCDSCAMERKKAHEEGHTLLAILQREKLGRVSEFCLIPTDPTLEDEEKYLRDQGVNVERFLTRAHERAQEAFAGLTSRERSVMRARFARDPKVLAMFDEVERREKQ